VLSIETCAFCECPAGIEAQYPPTETEHRKPEDERFHRGADWPAMETTRVHANIATLLVAGCNTLWLLFTADAVQRAKVLDNGVTIEIKLATAADRLCVSPSDMEKGLARIQRRRAVRITLPVSERPGAISKSDIVTYGRPITQDDIDRAVEAHRRKRFAEIRIEPPSAAGKVAELYPVGVIQ